MVELLLLIIAVTLIMITVNLHKLTKSVGYYVVKRCPTHVSEDQSYAPEERMVWALNGIQQLLAEHLEVKAHADPSQKSSGQ